MDYDAIRNALPVLPSAEYQRWIKNEAYELIPSFLLHHAERISLYKPLTAIMTAQDRDPIGSAWIERCLCTVCADEFETAHVPGGFTMYSGPDGHLYEVYDDEIMMDDDVEDYGYDGQFVQLADNDSLECPLCGARLTVFHRSNLRGGRIRQILGAEVCNIDNYTAVICWLTAVKIFDDGSYDIDTYPRDAYVIDDYGRIIRFRRTCGTGSYATERAMDHWEEASSHRDTFSIPYHDWGSINNKKVGGSIWRNVPDLTGCTGEKSGIKEYIQQGGEYPVTYLKLWSKYRTVENLVKAGWGSLVNASIGRHAMYNARTLCSDLPGADFSKSRPHEILRMSKADFKALSVHPTKWSLEKFTSWTTYRERGGSCSALEYERYYKTFKTDGFHLALAMMGLYPGLDLPKLAAYMDKQGMSHSRIDLLADTRRMAQDLHPDIPLSLEELWPRRLQDAHDRLSGAWLLRQNKQKSRSLDEGFARIIDVYGHLQWSDGDLSILLPQTNDDLVREGSVLRHCVGTYGKGHTEGRSVIFFVRKYRRPERCYYTLDICMTNGKPYEVQLHGYGNERHGENKEHAHKIPAKVRAFVDRWKSEVLIPWYLNNQGGAKTA